MHDKLMPVIIPATLADYSTVQNLARFYVYDLSRECGFISKDWAIPQDGLYESFDFKNYFEDEDRRAYLVKSGDELAGFVLLNQAGELSETRWNMGEFFILAKFQGRGIGKQAAHEIWRMHPGCWEVSVIPENKSALTFWRSAISQFTGGSYKEEVKIVGYDKDQPKRIIFSFDTNSNGAEIAIATRKGISADISSSIIDYLNNYYGVEAHTLTSLPLGADANALIYKADTIGESYFIKLKRGIHNDASSATLHLLKDAGLKQIILPLTTIKGQPVQHIEGHTLIAYPFVVGENGFNKVLMEEQWTSLGATLRKLHEVNVPILLQRRLRREIYSSKWRDLVLSLYDYIKTEPTVDGVALELYSFMKENAEAIHRLINCAEQLAQKLRNDSLEFVLCHSDIHAGNVLIDPSNAIYIVDWDDPVMAPKERDLMFIGGGVGNVWNIPNEEALFYKGYGKTEINKTALAYYRHERIVEDIAEFGESIFFTEVSNEVKLENYKHFKSIFEPRGVVEIAFKTMEKCI